MSTFRRGRGHLTDPVPHRGPGPCPRVLADAAVLHHWPMPEVRQASTLTWLTITCFTWPRRADLQVRRWYRADSRTISRSGSRWVVSACAADGGGRSPVWCDLDNSPAPRSEALCRGGKRASGSSLLFGRNGRSGAAALRCCALWVVEHVNVILTNRRDRWSIRMSRHDLQARPAPPVCGSRLYLALVEPPGLDDGHQVIRMLQQGDVGKRIAVDDE